MVKMATRTYEARVWDAIANELENDRLAQRVKAASDGAASWGEKITLSLTDTEDADVAEAISEGDIETMEDEG